MSVSGKRMCTSNAYSFRGLSLPRKSASRITDRLAPHDLNSVDWAVNLKLFQFETIQMNCLTANFAQSILMLTLSLLVATFVVC